MGGPSYVSQPQQAQPLPQAMPYLTSGLNFLQSQVGTSAAPWPGPYGAPATPEMQAAAGATWDTLDQAMASGVTPAALATTWGIESGMAMPGMSPYLTSWAQGLIDLTKQQEQQNIADLEARYAMYGQPKSSLAAQGVAQLEAADRANLMQTLGQQGLSAYETGIGQQLQAAGMGSSYTPTVAGNLLQAGQALYSPEETALQQAIQEYQRVQQSIWTPLSPLGSFVPSGSSTPQFGPSTLQEVAGPLGAAVPYLFKAIFGV
jgi:hypothetical protein